MRKVEVFSAGCPMCDDAVRLVKSLSCPSCEVTVHDLKTEAGMRKARQYGIASAPSVVIDGQVAPCCARGGVDAAALRAAGLGTPTA